MAAGNRRLLARKIGCLTLAVLLAGFGGGPEPSAAATLPPGLEDRPAPFVPQRPVSEAEADRAEALRLFAAGRLLERRQDFSGALRRYQRALRLDPQATTICNAILQLAVRSKRLDEAVRYALHHRPPEASRIEPMTYLQLATYLSEQGQWKSARRLYELVLQARVGQAPTPGDVYLHLELGRTYQLEGVAARSADHFARVAEALEHPERFKLDEAAREKLLKEQGLLYVLMGESFLQADRPSLALAAYEKAEAGHPQPGLWDYRRARVLAKIRKPAEALQALTRYFDRGLAGEGLGPYELLAEILKQQGKAAELLAWLERLHGADPVNLPLAYSLAEQYRAAGRLDQAERLYRSVMGKGSALSGYRPLVEIYLRQRRPQALLEVLGEATRETLGLESLLAPLEMLRKDRSLLNAVIETARKRSQSPAKLEPAMAAAVAMIALDDRRLEAAAEFFEIAIAGDPKRAAELILAWGEGLLEQEQAAQAVDVFRKAIDRKWATRANAAFFYFLSGALEVGGRTDEALAAATKAAELRASSARMAARKAWVLYHAKRRAEARAAYEAVLQRFAKDDTTAETRLVLRDARLALSNLHVLAGQNELSQQRLEEVLDEFPDDISALNDLGYLWAERGVHLGRARRMIEQAVAAEPDNAAYRDSLGWVLYQQGQYAQAVRELEKAAADPKPDGTVLDHLGDAYRKAGQPRQAAAAWRRAIDQLRAEKEDAKVRAIEEKLHKTP